MDGGERVSDEQVDEALRALQEVEPSTAHIDDVELMAYADQRLSPERAALCDPHLAECAECRAILVGLGEASEEERVARAVRAMASSVRLHRARNGLAVVLATAAVGVGAWVVSSGRRAPVPEFGMPDQVGHESQVRSMSYELRDEQVRASILQSGAVLRPETGIDLVLRPRVKTDPASLSLSLYISRPGAPVEAVPSSGVSGANDDTPMLVVKRGAEGTFQVLGRGRHLFRGGSGDYDVTFVIAPPGSPCQRMDGHTLAEAEAMCRDAIFWRDVRARFVAE